MNVNEKLFELRKQRGLSQENLADIIGVSRQAVQKWESGASQPDLANLVALSRYFGCTVDSLIAGEQTVAPVQSEPDNTPYHYEYKSRRKLFGLPLVHINFGFGARRAKGIIALGNIATGLIAVGGLSFGLLSLGGLSLGLVALGGLALGGAALGGVAAGILALGGAAFGYVAFGGLSVGVYAAGGAAFASHAAVGDHAVAAVAAGKTAVGEIVWRLQPGEAFPEAAFRTAVLTRFRGTWDVILQFLCSLSIF